MAAERQRWSEVSDKYVERLIWDLDVVGAVGRRKEEVLLRSEDGARRLRRRLELIMASKRGTDGSWGFGVVGDETVRWWINSLKATVLSQLWGPARFWNFEKNVVGRLPCVCRSTVM